LSPEAVGGRFPDPGRRKWMRKGRFARVVAVLAVLSVVGLAAGCYGKFQLTREVYRFNSSIEDKYLRSAVTWALVIVPVYGITAFLDFVVFNVIEFWSGKNPITSAGSATKVYSRGDERAVMTLARDGEATVATIERFDRAGACTSRLRIRDDGRGKVEALETAGGATCEIRARRMADGSVEVTDSRGGGPKSFSREAVRVHMARLLSGPRLAVR
jgi:hypothetical protein